ncbi:hypothetical protein CN151_21485 [Sinorhizobium meliloti]|nr:hypothetical protein SMRU11_28015 [Sinorhizobium meliloti RU11/001]ASP52585.1 hypothetical protein CDO31_14135 [Sinorhizobium meliloti]PST22736.1 hypothetical protein C7U62_19950 [Mesorhizobium loti]ASP58844.1 hypothetical protein CDO30_11425 [Sinorhizobium meliloti]ASP65716.1 hypothetical protein CDO29_14680 [Sinorhizobium meliloti]
MAYEGRPLVLSPRLRGEGDSWQRFHSLTPGGDGVRGAGRLSLRPACGEKVAGRPDEGQRLLLQAALRTPPITLTSSSTMRST